MGNDDSGGTGKGFAMNKVEYPGEAIEVDSGLVVRDDLRDVGLPSWALGSPSWRSCV